MSSPLPIPVDDSVKLRKLAIIADACLALDDLRQLGLLEGGVGVDRSRCAFIIACAHERNIVWTEGERNEAAVKLVVRLVNLGAR